jgi:polar amino acid transport system substrate-binding protein
LSAISKRFYRDQSNWPAIWQANADKVYQNGALILVGTQLVIPDVGTQRPQPTRSSHTRVDPATGVKEIDLVTGNEYKPYSDEELPAGGLVTEIVDRAFRHMGYEPVIDYINWPSGYDLTRRTKFAATFPYAPTDERKQDFLYSDSVADTLTYVYWRNERDFQYRGLEDLRGQRVCRPTGYFHDFLDELIDSGQIDFYQPRQLDTCFRDVVEGTADVVVIGELDGYAKLVEMKLADQIVRSDVAANVGGLHVIFPKSDPNSQALLQRFDSVLGDMKRSGEMAEIAERHLKAYYASFAPSSS